MQTTLTLLHNDGECADKCPGGDCLYCIPFDARREMIDGKYQRVKECEKVQARLESAEERRRRDKADAQRVRGSSHNKRPGKSWHHGAE